MWHVKGEKCSSLADLLYLDLAGNNLLFPVIPASVVPISDQQSAQATFLLLRMSLVWCIARACKEYRRKVMV